MANEAILRVRMEDPVGFEVNVAMEKGTICKLSGDRLIGKSSADGDIFAGVLAHEVISGDGRTQAAVFRRGIFDMVACGAITRGDVVKISGTNLISTADDDVGEHASQNFGTCLETAADAEVVQVLVHV